MGGSVEHDARLVVFLMVNPFVGQPFYVGTKQAGARLNERGHEDDLEHRRRLIMMIREAGGKIQRISVAGVNSPRKATAAQAFWVRALVHGGVDVINYEAPPEARARAFALHAESCRVKAASKATVLPSSRQAELQFLPENHGGSSSVQVMHSVSARRTEPRCAWTETDENALCKRFIDNEDIGLIAIGLGRTVNALLLKLNELQKSRPELRPRMVRSRLCGGSLGAYRLSKHAIDRFGSS